MSRRVAAAALALGAALAPAPAIVEAAQPDPRRMSGIPLPDAELPDGAISVRVIRGRLDNNVTGHMVELRQGDVVETATTDAEGRALFLTLNAGRQVRAATELDGTRIESRPFAVPGRGGVRLMLVGTDPAAAADPAAPAPPGLLTFGGESFVQVELVEESVEVYYFLDVVNPAEAPVEPPAPIAIDLPRGAQGVTVLQGSAPGTAADGPRVELPGPMAPGATPLRVAYVLPYSGPRLVLVQPFPLDWESVLLAVEQWGSLDFASAQVSRRTELSPEAAGGAGRLLGAGPRLAAGDPLTLELTGLPHRSALPTTVALLAALAILAAGCWGAAGSPAPAPAETRRRLEARRERLFADLVKVERQRRDGRIGRTRYLARRGELFDALESVCRALDAERAPAAESGPACSAPGGAAAAR